MTTPSQNPSQKGSFGGAFELRECAARVALALEFEYFDGLDEGQPERLPDIGHAFRAMGDMRICVQGTWGDAQTLFALGNRRIIDRLDIDRVAIEQHVGRALAEFGIADAHWHDVGRVRRHREAGRAQSMFGEHRLALMQRAEFIALSLLQEAYGGCRGGGERWRQSRGENEGGRERAYGIDDRRLGGDIGAKRSKSLGERPLNDVESIHDAVAFGDASATRTVETDRMHFVDVGHGVVTARKIGDLRDRGDVAMHRIETFEDDQLGPLAPRRAHAAAVRRRRTPPPSNSRARTSFASPPIWRRIWPVRPESVCVTRARASRSPAMRSLQLAPKPPPEARWSCGGSKPASANCLCSAGMP